MNVERFKGLRALVVGDVMIDTYTTGVVERMSPEAPVPVLSVRSRFERLGGAANVALNLKALGAEPVVCSVVGDDDNGQRLIQLMREQGLEVAGIVGSNRRMTTVKHRVIDGDRHLLRIDEEDTFDLTATEQAILSQIVSRFIDQERIDVVVLQDYNKGVLTETLIQKTLAWAKEKGIPVVVDPKKKNFLAYEGVTLFKPNAKELREGLGLKAEALTELQQAMLALQQRIHCEYLMTTLSEQGVMMLHDGGFHHVAAHPRHIVDVSGAGDTVLSVAALGVALRLDAEEIAQWSNIAGGLVCEHAGVVPINKERFAEEVEALPQ